MSDRPSTSTVTVAICTYNRADCIADAIHSSLGQKTSFEFDVLVVDNNSSDNTAEIVRDLQQQYPNLHYCVETQQGLSYARNRALDDAMGWIVAFIDDDCITPDGWLENIYSGFADSKVACVGGRIDIGYPNGRPDWLHHKLESFLGKYDLGLISKEAEHFFGGNLAVRKETAISLGGFCVDLGYSANNKIAGEDIDFCIRARQAGFRAWYVPEAWLIHNVQAERITQKWFRQKARDVALTRLKMTDDLDVQYISAEMLMYIASYNIFRLLGRKALAFNSLFRYTMERMLLGELIRSKKIGRLQVCLTMIVACPLAIWHLIKRTLKRRNVNK